MRPNRAIDFDRGQLSASGERPPVEWPCCLLSIDYTNCRDLAVEENTQLVMADITLRVAFPQAGETHNHAPEKVRDMALQMLDTVEKLHDALQGETLGDTVSALSRSRATMQTRSNKIVVFNLIYSTTFQEVKWTIKRGENAPFRGVKGIQKTGREKHAPFVCFLIGTIALKPKNPTGLQFDGIFERRNCFS